MKKTFVSSRDSTLKTSMNIGDLVAVITTDWETTTQEKLGLIISTWSEYMNGSMFIVLLEGKTFSIHEREARVIKPYENSKNLS